MKKIIKKVKIIYYIVLILVITIFVFLLGIIMFGILGDKAALNNAVNINAVTLLLGILSLPGLAAQLISLVTVENEKSYKLTGKCPNCKHLSEFKLEEK